MIDVKVARVPGSKHDLTLNDGATRQDAINTAGLTVSSGENVQANGVVITDLNTPCENCERIVISAGAKGNRS